MGPFGPPSGLFKTHFGQELSMPTVSSTTYVDNTLVEVSYDGPLPIADDVTKTVRRISLSQSRTDSGTVWNYRWKLKHGWNATSGLSGTEMRCDVTKGYFIHHTSSVSGSVHLVRERSGGLINFSQPSSPVLSVTEATNQAISSFVSHARSAQTSIQGGVVLGELGETLRMIRNPAMAFRRGLSEYLRVLRSRYRRRNRNANGRIVSDTWLEFSYGWKPLIHDIRDGAKALARDSSLLQDLIPVSGYGQSQSEVSASSRSVIVMGLNSYAITQRQWDENIVVYKGAVKSYTSNPAYMSAKNLGFSPDDFIPTVWELIPYSFLVDYFTNIGDILSAWSFRDCNVAWSCATTIRKRNSIAATTDVVYGTPANRPLELSRNYVPGSVVSYTKLVQRGVPSSLVPSLAFEIPGMRSKRWINLSALALSSRETSKLYRR